MISKQESEKINGLAFPKPDNEEYYPQDGLTKREYFAGLAMQGIIASGNYSEIEAPCCAVNLADELLKQLQND
jgi:hypothetical protein